LTIAPTYVKGDNRERGWSSRGDPRGARQQGQVSNIKARGDRAAQFELTTVEGIARVFEISVEERG
jgi:hypothetical protein